MANKDDDLIKQQGNDFNPDEVDEFAIPDEPLSDADENDDDDLDLGLGSSDDDEDEDDMSLGSEEDEYEDEDTDAGEGEAYEEEEASTDEFKLGWKTYTGLALATVIVAGGLGSYVMGAMGGNDNRATSEQAREVIRQRADEGLARAQQQQVPQQNQQPSIQVSSQAPVNVQPFPGANNGSEAMVPPQSDGGSGSVSSNSINRSDSNGESPLASLQPSEREQQAIEAATYSERLNLNDMTAFQSLSTLANRNREDIDDLKHKRSSLPNEVNSLEDRVTSLEEKLDQLIASGSIKTQVGSDSKDSVKTDTPAKKQAPQQQASKKQESGPVEYEPVAPKTPAQIKALQRQLAIYGYRPGVVDGLLGGNTRSAVERLQREHGLPANGWLTQDTLNALETPKHYSGTYAPQPKTEYADHPRDEEKHNVGWYVRGLTNDKAIVYRLDGMSYAVIVGTEIPGMGQVTKLDPSNHQVVTVKGTIGKRKAG